MDYMAISIWIGLLELRMGVLLMAGITAFLYMASGNFWIGH